MKRVTISICLLLCVIAFALGQEARQQTTLLNTGLQNPALKTTERQKQSSTASKAEEEVLRVVNERRAAILRRDAAAWSRLLADDFIGITSSGQVITKAQQLERYKFDTVQYRLMEHSEHQVRLYGNTAVVTYLSVSNQTSQEPTAKSYNRWTHVLVKQNGHWQIAHSQGTRMEQPK